LTYHICILNALKIYTIFSFFYAIESSFFICNRKEFYLHMRDHDGVLNTLIIYHCFFILALFVTFSSSFVFPATSLIGVCSFFFFNYCDFCGFLILFYFNSWDVWPLSNCFEGFVFSIALKRTLGFQQFFI